jgi:energy-coupling factor transporter transmembrane protein EcfT
VTTPEENKPNKSPEELAKSSLNKRLESAAWGLFLIMLGCLWLIPDNKVPQDVWMLGAGIILLGLNAIRFIARIPVRGFSIFLGFLGVLLGIGGLIGIDLPVFPILLILIGISVLIGPLFRRKITID